MLGSRIEELLASEMEASFAAVMPDETKQRQLLLEDEEEDFMDEGKKVLTMLKYSQITV